MEFQYRRTTLLEQTCAASNHHNNENIMRFIIAAMLLILTIGASQAIDAPNFKKMSVDETQAYFAGKTFLLYDRKWGNDLILLSKNGKAYFYGSSFGEVVKAGWTVLAEPGKVMICFSGPTNKVKGARITTRACDEARNFVKLAVDAAAGDVIGIAKGRKPGFVDSRKTTLAKLKAGMR